MDDVNIFNLASLEKSPLLNDGIRTQTSLKLDFARRQFSLERLKY